MTANSSHLSQNCPLPQVYTRCIVCDNVCLRSQSHKIDCSNKNFRSNLLSPETISGRSIIEFGFRGVQNVSLVDGQSVKEISSVPIFIFNYKCFVFKRRKCLVCFLPCGIPQITFVGNTNEFMTIKPENNSFIVNDRYRYHEHGTLEFNPDNMGLVESSGRGLRFELIHSEDFAIRVIKFGVIEFKGFDNGVLFIDPLANNLNLPVIRPNETNGNVFIEF